MSIAINFGSSKYDRKRQQKRTEAESFLSESANPSVSDRGVKPLNPLSRFNAFLEVRVDRQELTALFWENTYTTASKTPGWLSIFDSENLFLYCLAAKGTLITRKFVSETAFPSSAAMIPF
ncbi:hypothetical protein [Lyngbya aestuarii]|uniref:hypothetical protein n=1 Tax=Lyngbya aestuarii TaxID=118322 RepID=UPI00403D58CF